MNALEYLNKFKDQVDRNIDTLFEEELNKNLKINPENVLIRLQRFSKRGKNIRSGLFLLSLEMFKVKQKKVHYQLAAGLEIMHSALLIHDDIMDNDDKRRGEESIHKYYLTQAQQDKAQEPYDYSNGMGICAGDVEIFMAYKILIEASNKLPARERMLSFLTDEFLQVGFAQIKDIQFCHLRKEPTNEEIKTLYTHKTARYTFSLPLILGALAAGAGEAAVKKLAQFGENIGLLFQLRDDEIGLFNEPEVTGKPRGSDIRENKKTFILSLLLSSCNKIDDLRLRSILRKRIVNKKTLKVFDELITKYDVMEKISSMKKEYKEKSIHIINSLDIDEKHKKIFFDLIDYISERNR